MANNIPSPHNHWLAGWRYLPLLLAFLLLFCVAPFVGSSARLIADLLFLLVLGASFKAVEKHRRIILLALVLSLGSLFSPANTSGLAQHNSLLAIWEQASSAIFLMIIVITILADILWKREATMDSVLGAACVYLLMGVFWSRVFLLLELWQPGSFALPSLASAPDRPPFAPLPLHTPAEMLYFSYITLTTVGYGDFLPISMQAKMLSVLEAVLGQLFIAITIGNLIGQAISNKSTRKTS